MYWPTPKSFAGFIGQNVLLCAVLFTPYMIWDGYKTTQNIKRMTRATQILEESPDIETYKVRVKEEFGENSEDLLFPLGKQ